MAEMITHISDTGSDGPGRQLPQEFVDLLHDPARAALVEQKRLAAESADLQDFRDDIREEIAAGRATPEASERLGQLTLVQAEVDGDVLMSQRNTPAGPQSR